MTKLSVVVVLAVVALLLFPVMAFADTPPEIPCRFYGDVTVDGEDVADGTAIQALIGGEVVAEVTTTTDAGGSSYGVKVVQPAGASYEGATVSFKIGAQTADQTDTWVRGMNVNVDLSVGEAGPSNGGVKGDQGEPGEKGDKGDTGDPGAPGAPGEPGEDAAGGIALPVVALVIAIIAAGMAAMGMRRKI